MFQWIERNFELQRGKSNHLRPMEGMRGFAVLLVFFIHFNSLFIPDVNSWLRHAVDAVGHTGVDLFFVLSGYLIYGSLTKQRAFSAKAYTWTRVKRLYPVFLVVMIIYITLYGLGVVGNSPIPEGSDKWLYLLASFSLQPYVFGYEPLVTVAWTLAYEASFYALVPIIMVALNGRGVPANIRTAFMLIVLILGVIYFHFYSGPERILMFIVGILIYDNRTPLSRCLAHASWSILGFVILCVGVILVDLYQFPLMLGTTLIGLGLFFMVSQGLLSKAPFTFFNFAPLRYLGNMSYSYYLTHSIALHGSLLIITKVLGVKHFDGFIIYYVAMLLSFLATLAFSALVFISIEKPLSLKK